MGKTAVSACSDQGVLLALGDETIGRRGHKASPGGAERMTDGKRPAPEIQLADVDVPHWRLVRKFLLGELG